MRRRVTKNILKSHALLEAFLSVCAGNSTVAAVKADLEISRQTAHQYLGQLASVGLLDKKGTGKGGRPGRGGRIGKYRFEPNFEAVIQLNSAGPLVSTRKGPAGKIIWRSVQGWMTSKCIKTLKPLCERYLKRLVGLPIWQEKCLYEEMDLCDVSERFLEYLTLNKQKLSRGQQEAVDEYLRGCFQTVDGPAYLTERQRVG